MTPHAGQAAADVTIAGLFDLTGQVAIVTGASSGIGQAGAEILAQAGASVALLGRDRDRLADVARGIIDAGGACATHVADVSDRGQMKRVMADVVAQIGAPDIVMANAGIGAGPSYRAPGGGLAEYSEEIWDRVIATNLTGVFTTLRESVPYMRTGGRMLVTASTAGLRADPMVGYAYVVAKAGVLNLVRQAALEFAPRGIRVNAIAPGPFRTRIGGGKPLPPERVRAWEETIPLGRMGDTSELKGPILFLASGAASFVTGATLPVDGGALALSHSAF